MLDLLPLTLQLRFRTYGVGRAPAQGLILCHLLPLKRVGDGMPSLLSSALNSPHRDAGVSGSLFFTQPPEGERGGWHERGAPAAVRRSTS